MGTVPSPYSPIAGDDATQARVVTWADSCAYMLGGTTSVGSVRASAELRQTVSTSPATGVWTDITMDVEDLDTEGGHSTTVNTARYTAQTSGWYLVSGGVSWTGNATASRRGARIAKNGTAVTGSQVLIYSATVNGLEVPVRAMKVQLAGPGDYITIQGFQDAVATLATVVAAPGQSSMSVTWMHS